jgi:hypothetical protein
VTVGDHLLDAKGDADGAAGVKRGRRSAPRPDTDG